jgi:hypothetical protein
MIICGSGGLLERGALLLRGAVQMANHSLSAKVVVNAAEEIGG